MRKGEEEEVDVGIGRQLFGIRSRERKLTDEVLECRHLFSHELTGECPGGDCGERDIWVPRKKPYEFFAGVARGTYDCCVHEFN